MSNEFWVHANLTFRFSKKTGSKIKFIASKHSKAKRGLAFMPKYHLYVYLAPKTTSKKISSNDIAFGRQMKTIGERLSRFNKHSQYDQVWEIILSIEYAELTCRNTLKHLHNEIKKYSPQKTDFASHLYGFTREFFSWGYFGGRCNVTMKVTIITCKLVVLKEILFRWYSTSFYPKLIAYQLESAPWTSSISCLNCLSFSPIVASTWSAMLFSLGFM